MPAPRQLLPLTPALAKFGNRVRRTRRRCGMNQTQLANQFGFFRRDIVAIETGRCDPSRFLSARALRYEKLRIWAEMNKNAPRKRFLKSGWRVFRLPQSVARAKRKQEEKKNERKDPE